MNTNNGRIYELGEDFDLEHIKRLEAGPGRQVATEQAAASGITADVEDFAAKFDDHAAKASEVLGRDLRRDEMDALRDALKGDTIVPVTGRVAQTMNLGERERARRKQRRKASKRARRGNR